MVVNGPLRFLIFGGGINTGSSDQFPTEIRLTYNGAVSIWTNPTNPASYGQGIGRDYTLRSGTNPLTAGNLNISCLAVYP